MLNNLLIIDRARLTSLEHDGKSYYSLIMMDYVFVREEDGTYTCVKNRHNNEKPTGLTGAEVLNGIVTIAMEQANGR